MAWLIVRVELKSGSSTDYMNLHEAMRKAGYSRRIVAGDGTVYHMPTAEYVAVLGDTFTATAVRDSLQPIIKAVHSNYDLFVSKASDVAWYLAPVS